MTVTKILKQNIDKLTYDMVNYLDAEKLERGQIFYDHNQIVDLSEFLEKKLSLFTPIVKEKGIQLLSKIENNAYIKADPAAVDRIVNNLIDNAIKYTEKGSVTVELIKQDTTLAFTVKDTGIGMKEEEQQNLYTPYYQASHNKRNIQGIGMGLYITKQIINELKGEIATESKPGEGTLFTVSLPLYTPAEDELKTLVNYQASVPIMPVKTIKLQEPEYDKEKLSVLLVEDNVEMLSYIQNNLKENYNTFSACNGKEALHKLNLIPKPDLILCDIMMDEMDGYCFYDELKAKGDYADIPLIFITAKTTDMDKMKGLSKGAVDYIYKPFSMKELVLKVDNVLKNRAMQKESNIKELENKISVLFRTREAGTTYLKFEQQCEKYKITTREKEIIQLIKQGLAQKNIAAELNLTIGTVKSHLNNIYTKCNIQTNIELINLFYS